MKMIAAPRIVDGADPRSVLVANPTDPGSRVTLEFNATITAEYMSPEHRAPQTRQLSNATAYCVQLLRHAFAQTCWKNLD
jgi:hypothetical protein